MSVEKTHSEFDQQISRYLSGELSPEELRDFEELLRSDPELKARVAEYRKIWDAADESASRQSYDLDAEWKLMKAQIPELSMDNADMEHHGKSRSLLFYTYRIAAVLIAGLLIAFGWMYGTNILGTEKIVAHDEALEVLLEDGTHIILNRDSKLRYKKSFAPTGRKVSLNGEAWFDVARDTARPFVIDAGPATVEVLGTSFNVNAYKINSTVEITVKSGMVALTSGQEKQAKQEQLILRAGNSGTYHKQNQEMVLIPQADPNNISWKTRELYFDDSSLQEVVDLLNKVYGAHLVIANEELAACPLTVTFSNQSLEAILNVLKVTLDLKLSRQGDEIRLDGTACN